jgi:hypothetical protein
MDENRNPASPYVREKLYAGVRKLAIGLGPVKERLEWAWEDLVRIGPADFPENLRQEVDEIWEFLTSKGPPEQTLFRKRNKTCMKIAERIFHLWLEVRNR